MNPHAGILIEPATERLMLTCRPIRTGWRGGAPDLYSIFLRRGAADYEDDIIAPSVRTQLLYNNCASLDGADQVDLIFL